jgi:hypothetical protein
MKTIIFLLSILYTSSSYADYQNEALEHECLHQLYLKNGKAPYKKLGSKYTDSYGIAKVSYANKTYKCHFKKVRKRYELKEVLYGISVL